MMISCFAHIYSYYGLSCILAVYFRYDLGFSQPTSEAFVRGSSAQRLSSRCLAVYWQISGLANSK